MNAVCGSRDSSTAFAEHEHRCAEREHRCAEREHRCAEHEHRCAEHEKGDSLDLVTIGEFSLEPLRFDQFERPLSGVVLVLVLSEAVLVLVLERRRKAGIDMSQGGSFALNRIALIQR